MKNHIMIMLIWVLTICAVMGFFAGCSTSGSSDDDTATDDDTTDDDSAADDDLQHPEAPDQAGDCPTPASVPQSGVTWASEVIDFSTQWGEELDDWSAADALNAPNCLDENNIPEYGDLPCAWASSEVANGDFIELGFALQPDPAYDVLVYEVIGIDGLREALITYEDNSTELFQHTPAAEKDCFKLIDIVLSNPNGLSITKIKLTIDQIPVGYWTEFDAVGVRYSL